MAGIEDRLEGCAWFFLGSGALIMVLVNGLLLRSTPESSGLQPWGQKDTSRGQNTGIQMSEKRIPLTALFHNSRFWLIGFSYLSISYSLYGITTFMVDYAKYQLELPLEKASPLAAIHGICQIVGVLTILPLSDHLGRKRSIIVSNMLITATLAGIVVAGTSWMALCILNRYQLRHNPSRTRSSMAAVILSLSIATRVSICSLVRMRGGDKTLR